jgi:hypothetical protein
LKRVGNELHADDVFNRFDIERWLIKRIALCAYPHDPLSRRQCAAFMTEGVTTFDVRRARIVSLIIEKHLADQPIGKRSNGNKETFAAFCLRFYGEALPVSSGV